MNIRKKLIRLVGVAVVCVYSFSAFADTRGSFDMDRWFGMIDEIKAQAKAQKISDETIKETFKSPAFIPSIVRSDRNQAEFKLTLEDYLARTVNSRRIKAGKEMWITYPTLLGRVENKYGIQPHVILAFWGMESNYGQYRAAHKLTDAFFTLIYEGRRQTFFTNQLLALMKTADKNNLDINDIYGSWAGAMGHFQFIPTTLAQYGADGNGDGKIDIIHSVGDAMFSAGNYLNKLGWNQNQKIVRKVMLPADFNIELLDGKVRKPLSEWAAMGVLNPDGSQIPVADMTAGLVSDIKTIKEERERAMVAATQSPDPNAIDTDVAPQQAITAYLTYPNFYIIKKWNSSNWYAIAIALLADELK